MRSARTAALLSGLSLAFPGAALAQGSSGLTAQAGGTGQSAQPLTSSAPSSGSSSGASSSAGSTSTPSATSSPRLPSTGADAGLLALTGAGLLLAGAGLRLRLQAPSALPE